MNKHCHRRIFSKRLGAIVAVAETARSQGKSPGEGSGDGGPSGGSRFALKALYHSLLMAAVGGALVSVGMSRAVAQAIPVPAGSNLSTTPGSTPVNGAIWVLQGNVTDSGTITLPAGASGLAIESDNAGTVRTITLNNGAALYGRFASSNAAALTLGLTDIRLTGGNQATDGGAISVTSTTSAGLTINTSGTVGFDNNIANRGGSIYSFGPLTVNGSTGSAFSVTNSRSTGGGGGIFSARAVSIAADTVTLSGNTAGASGGAINANGAVTIDGALTLSNNKASGSGNGGGILTNAGDITVNGSVSANTNTATSGGAFYTANGAVDLATTDGEGDVVLTGNTANLTQGGAIYAGGANGSVSIGNANGRVLIGVDGLGNAAGNTSGGSGGAISSNGTTTIAGSEVTLANNQARGGVGGGAIYSAGATTITGGTVTLSDNSATGASAAAGGGGGAINSTGTTTITGTGEVILSNNRVTGAGGTNVGGGAVLGGVVIITGSAITLSDNHATAQNANASGGAIAAGNTTLTGDTVTLSNNSITATGNSSSGGAISSGTVTINGALTLSDNHADGVSNSGGGIYAGAGGIEVNGNVSADGNTAGRNGGAFSSESVVSFTGDTTKLTNNTAGQDGGAIRANGAVQITGALALNDNQATDGYGGGIAANLGNITVDGGVSMDGNRALRGGGVYATDGDISLAANGGDVALTNNNATTMGGGAVYAGAGALGNSGNGNVSIGNAGGSVLIDLNTAGSSGGGIWSGGTTTIVGNTIDLTNNSAAGAGEGGGAVFSAGAVEITGALTLNDNQATNGFGGGIWSRDSSVTIHGDVSASGNLAAQSGGAIDARQALTIEGTLELNDNEATSNVGGGLYSVTDAVTVQGAVSADGNSARAGGAIYAATNVDLATTPGAGNVVLTNNAATAQGGGAVYSNGDVSIGNTDGTVRIGGTGAGNTAVTSGGAIYATGKTTLSGSTVTLANNRVTTTTASGGGGAVYSQNGAVLIEGALTLNDNHADGAASFGGGIYAQNGSITVNGDVSADGNTAGRSGGAFRSGTTVTLTGDTIELTNNKAGLGPDGAGNGGAISASNGAVQITGALTLNDNEAITGYGGGIYTGAGNITVAGSVDAVGNTGQLAGGAFYTPNGAVDLATSLGDGDVVLTDNTATTQGGGAVYAGGANGNVSIGNAGGLVRATGNTAGSSGGAIYAAGATTITGSEVTLSDNRATGAVQAGGAVYSIGTVTIDAPMLTLDDNQASGENSVGGGIASMTGGITVNGGVSADSNSASVGGAFAAVGGGVSLAAASGDVSLTGNAATAGNGGAVNAYGDVTIGHAGSTVDLTGNHADAGHGGAIYNADSADGALTIDGSAITISGNSAGFDGGAIHVGNGVVALGTASIGHAASAVTMSGNSAGADGGAISASGDVSILGSTIELTDNHAGTDPAVVGSATAGGSGGGIATLGLVSIGNSDGTTGSIVITGNTAASETFGGGAVAAGGGVVIDGGTIDLSDNHATAGSGGAIIAGGPVTITGALTMNDNTAEGGNGGGISVLAVPALGYPGGDIIVHGSISADGNTASGNGGAFYLDAGAVNLATGAGEGDVILTGNRAGATGGAVATGDAAGNSISIGNLQGQVRIADNTAGFGGAIYSGSASGITLRGNSIELTGNTATTGAGGAVNASFGAARLTSADTATLSGNTAQTNGGAISAREIHINDTAEGTGEVVIAGNAATAGGGALFASNIFIGNAQSVVRIGEDALGQAAGNTAGTDGGAIYSGSRTTITGREIVIAHNEAQGILGGGAIRGTDGVQLNAGGGSVTVSDNHTDKDGGALLVVTRQAGSQGAVVITGALTMEGNTAGGRGGAVYAGTAASTSAAGADDALLLLNATGDSVIADNSAGGAGGAFHANGNVTLNATGGDITFSGNTQNTATAAQQANAIWFNGAASTATLNAAAGHTIAFFDPVASDAAKGAVAVNVQGGGTVLFDGSQYSAAADRTSGILANTTVSGTGTTLRVDNGAVYGAAGSTVAVQSGNILAGSGTITGNTTLADGAILNPGGANTAGTLTIDGNLVLGGNNTTLNYRFGEANVVAGQYNDLTQVNGNLTLDGVINVTEPAGGTFGPGVYRVFNYTGSLTDNTLELGTLPGGNTGVSVQTSVANQVNLVNADGLTLNFWDGDAGPKNNGVVNGGNGTWNSGATASDNWTDSEGALNAPWTPAAFAIFQGSPGTVTVDNSLGDVTASGMQFAANGYGVNGQPITLVETDAAQPGQTLIKVGDGSAAGAGYTATIGAVLQGDTQLVKDDLGTLVLTGANTYSGGTRINDGTLRISSDANLGDAAGNLTFDGGTLRIDTTVITNRATTLEAGGGTLRTDGGAQLTMGGAISGTGALTVGSSTAAVTLTANNSYTGGTTITGANSTLQLGNGGTTGSITGDIAMEGGATLAFNRSNSYTFDGTISGDGRVMLINSPGTTILTAANTYTGNTYIGNTLSASNGMLQLNHAQAAGTGYVLVNTAVTNPNAGLNLAWTDGAAFANQIFSGSFALGTVTVSGNATITGDNAATYQGAWRITGTAALDTATTTSTTNLGTGAVTITSAGVMNANTTGNFTFANALTGAGTLNASNSDGAFAFTANTGSDFAGTVALTNNTFALDGDNTAALTRAKLIVGADNVTTVGNGTQTIGGLAFDGGTMVFDATVPAQTQATSYVDVSGAGHVLDLGGAGTVQIEVPAAPAPGMPNPAPAGSTNLLAQDDGEILSKLAGISGGATVAGDASGLTLVDQSGTPITAATVVDIAQGGNKVAEGTYDYGLGTGTNGDGLYVDYELTQVNLIGTGANALALTPDVGASGAATDLSAKVTGTGDLAIAAGAGTVSLSNSDNDYTGQTLVRTGALRLDADNALGHTSLLQLGGGTTADIDGHTQTVGAFTGGAGAQLMVDGGNLTVTGVFNGNDGSTTNLGGGTLTLNGGGTAVGTLTGAGTLNLNGDNTFAVNSANGGSNADLSAAVNIAAAATATLNSVQGLGNTGTIDNAGNLSFIGADGNFAKSVSGAGDVNLTGDSDVVLTATGNTLSGNWNINDAASTLTASVAENLGTAAVNNAGEFHVDTSTDWQLDNDMTGAGTFFKEGAGTLTIAQANTAMTGPTHIQAGTLTLGNADGVGAGLVTIDTASGSTTTGLTLAFGTAGAAVDFDNQIAGAGTTTVSGNAVITGNNAATYGGLWNVTGTAAVDPATGTSTANLGTGEVRIAAGGTVNANSNGAFTFANALTGTGTLNASNGGNAFDFTAAAGNQFGGSVVLADNTFDLSGDNTSALTAATLVLDDGNVTTVGTGVQNIGGLAFTGGTAVFETPVPADKDAVGSINAAGTLDLTDAAGSTVRVDAAGFDNSQPQPITSYSLLAQDEGDVLLKLVSAGQVQGTAGSMALADLDGTAIGAATQVDITQGGTKVANGTWNYGLTTGAAGGPADGLYVGYRLTEVELLGNGALVLAPEAGATGLATDLQARVTGAGDLAIEAGAGAGNTVTLSNSLNDYTGITDVRTGTLAMAADDVLGRTSSLNVAGGAAFDTASFDQTVGALDAAAGSAVNVADGSTLTIDSAQGAGAASGLAAGTLAGSGSVVLAPSALHVDGAQSWSGTLTVKDGSHVIANTAGAFDAAAGVVLDAATATFTFGSAADYAAAWTAVPNGTDATKFSGAGVIETRDGADVTLAGDNTAFAGIFDIGSGTTLRASAAENLGMAAIADNGTFDAIADAGADWTLGNTVSGGGALTKTGAGTLTLSSANSYGGATTISAGTLQAGAANAFSPNSAVTVAANATLDLNGFDQTVAGLANGGMVNLGTNTAPGTVLTVKGDYTGQGGTIAFNTVLGDSSSATDRMVVTGATSGATKVQVTNAGGLGALTTGNGIELIEVGNAADSTGTFALTGRVAAGAYDYRLAGAGDGNWYLRSQLDCSLDPAAPACADPGNGGGGNGGGVPLYRPEVVVDTAIPALAARLGLATLGTWHERTGGEFAANATATGGNGKAGWARVFGDTGSQGKGDSGSLVERNAAFEDHGASYDFKLSGVQAGMDVLRSENGDGSRDLAGVYVGAGRASGDVNSVINFGFGAKAGSMSMDSYSLGGYYTHIGPSGWYVDTVLQGTRFSDVTAQSFIDQPQTLKTQGRGITASVEGGYPIALDDEKTLHFEPQAQLVYQRLSFDNGADAFGHIAFEDSNATYVRISGRLSKDWTSADGSKTSVWARASLWSDFGAQAKTTFTNLQGANPTTLGTDLGGDWAQVDVGVSAQINRNVSLFAVGDYSRSFRGGHSWGARAGLKVAW